MKKRYLLVYLAGLSFLTMGGHVIKADEKNNTKSINVSAYDYILDNDPLSDAPGVAQDLTGGWSWRQSSTNYNGDSRISYGFDDQYRFSFNKLSWGGSTSIYQYINDPLANGYTYYTMYDFGSWSAENSIPQMYAPQGWNVLANYSASQLQPQVVQHNYDEEGYASVADAIKVPTIKRKRTMIQKENNETDTEKDTITNKMVNTNQFLKNIHGKLTISDSIRRVEKTVTFANLNGETSKVSSISSSGNGLEQINKENITKSYRVTNNTEKQLLKEFKHSVTELSTSPTNKFEDMYYLNIDDEPIFNNSLDVYHLGEAKIALQPANMAAIFLSDYSQWEIVKKETLNGIETVQIKGKIPTFYQEKYQSSTFTMNIDDHTGVLLQLNMYDNNKLQHSITMDSLEYTATPSMIE